MEHRDNRGMLGTPLQPSLKTEVIVSAQNKIAPTAAVYSKWRQRAVARKERSLLDKTAHEATRNDSLYIQNRRPSQLEDVMDDEDRTYLRVRGVINKKQAGVKGPVSSGRQIASSFLASSVDLPEVIPKQASTVLGYRELQNIYSLRTKNPSRIQTKTQPNSEYQTLRVVSHALHQDLLSGLGYWDKESKHIQKTDLESKGGSDMAGPRKDLERTNIGDVSGYDSYEEDYTDQLANAGYKNLDAAAKLISRKLKESRTALTRTTGTKRRTMSSTGGDDHSTVMFSSFLQWRGLDKQKEWTEYVVPAQFAANPTHNYENDQLKTDLKLLPPRLQEEYGALQRVHKENLRTEGRNVNMSIAKAVQEEDAKLRRIRGLVLEDMEARFIAPRTLQEQETRNKQPHRELDGHYAGYSSRYLKHGETNRTSQPWKPENLLCKRLGVEVSQPTAVSSVQEMKAPLKNALLSSHQAEDFQIHSVTNADGQRVAVSSDYSVLQDGAVVPRVNDDVQRGVSDDRARKPSRQLVQTIFTIGRLEDEGYDKCDETASDDARIDKAPATKSKARGMHKIRAVDFF